MLRSKTTSYLITCPLSQHIRWNRHANLLRRFQINHKLKLCRVVLLVDRRAGAFQDLVYVSRSAPKEVIELLLEVNSRQPVFAGKLHV